MLVPHTRVIQIWKLYIALVVVMGMVCACAQPGKHSASPIARALEGGKLQGVSFNDPIRATASDQAIVLSAAKNEITNFAVQVSDLPSRPSGAISIRIKSRRD